VVFGVLTAVAINAWWGARQDAAREHTYLVQLAEDLRETEAAIAAADSLLAPTRVAATQLVRAFYLAPPPARDSILAWFSDAWVFETVRPTLATAEALVATGDLGLLRNGALRSALTAYLDRNRAAIVSHDEFVRRWTVNIDALTRYVTFSEALPHGLDIRLRGQDPFGDRIVPSPLPPERRGVPFPFIAEAFLEDRAAHDAAFELFLNNGTLTGMRRFMRESARELREQVEAELNR
jgi:hypothetical protein